MIFYTYNEKTKEFTGTQNAFIDPLETKKQGKNVYLVPANATDKKPLETKENQAVIFNGTEWEIIADYRGKTYYIGTEQHEMKELGDLPKGATFEPVEPEKTLDELKSEKLSELSTKASSFEQTENKDMYITSSLGYKVNADPKALRNIEVLIDLGVTEFRTYDNESVEITADGLKTLKKEIGINAVSLYQQKWVLQDLINKATAEEELNAVDIKFTMKDFSNVSA